MRSHPFFKNKPVFSANLIYFVFWCHICIYVNETYIKQVFLYDQNDILYIKNNTISTIKRHDLWEYGENKFHKYTIHDHFEYVVEAGHKYFAQVYNAYNCRFTPGVSGGYDSRLVLAFLIYAGICHKLYVYGKNDSDDVIIAKLISDILGIKLEHIDKDETSWLSVNEYSHNQKAVFYQMDGLSQYGFICNPVEIQTRKTRYSGGVLGFNGGCGEI